MNLSIKSASKEDLLTCCRVAVDPDTRTRETDWDAAIEAHLAAGPAYTFSYGPAIAFCVGIDLVRPGLGNVWALYSSQASTSFANLRQTIECGRGLFEVLSRQFRLLRLRATAEKRCSQTRRLLKALGFEKLRRSTRTRWVYVWSAK